MKIDFYPEEWEEFIENCDFTEEELEVIRLTRLGYYIQAIALKMNLSDSTIKRRRKSIVRKILHYIAFKMNKGK